MAKAKVLHGYELAGAKAAKKRSSKKRSSKKASSKKSPSKKVASKSAPPGYRVFALKSDTAAKKKGCIKQSGPGKGLPKKGCTWGRGKFKGKLLKATKAA